jgi:branched-chain amino acid aminotransferase
VHVRRGAPDIQDPKLNSHSKLNCILACIQATKAGFDEALMLDPHGFVATCNSTHFFIVRKGEVWTSTGKYCLDGITRNNIIKLCRQHGITVDATDFSLTDVYGSEEAFVTGTFAGVVPVVDIDGRVIGSGARGPTTRRLQELYAAMIDEECRSQ